MFEPLRHGSKTTRSKTGSLKTGKGFKLTHNKHIPYRLKSKLADPDFKEYRKTVELLSRRSAGLKLHNEEKHNKL